MAINKEIKNITSKQKEDILFDLLNSFLSPAFGSLPKKEIELKIFNILFEIGYLKENTKVYDLVSKLKVSKSKAKDLLYEREIRKYDEGDLDRKMIEILKDPSIDIKKEKEITLEVDNPLVSDHIKNRIQKLKKISDGSFSSSLIKLNLDAYVCLVEDVLDVKTRAKIDKTISSYSNPNKVTFTGILKALIKNGEIIKPQLKELLGDNIVPILEPFKSFFT